MDREAMMSFKVYEKKLPSFKTTVLSMVIAGTLSKGRLVYLVKKEHIFYLARGAHISQIILSLPKNFHFKSQDPQSFPSMSLLSNNTLHKGLS